ncbi:hypothetical protein COY23_02300, partial [bacterium (Candidatus Torokbacteria) CG_4_10_14_0_2_um_filter_35_8]
MTKKTYNIIAICLCLVFAIVAFLSVTGFNWKNLKYSGDALTSDEVSHIPAGYYYLKTQSYFINPEHPPIIKDIAALPLLILDPFLPEITKEEMPEFHEPSFPYKDTVFPYEQETSNNQWYWGRLFLFNMKSNPDVITFWSRLSIITFNTIFLYLLYLSLSKLWGKKASLLGLFLITASQFSIAHVSLVTMDFMSSILQIIGIIWFAIYLKKYINKERTLKPFLSTILFLALALLTKFSSVIILPAVFLSGLIYIYVTQKSWKELERYLLKFICLTIAVFFIISIFYAFHVQNMDNDDMIIQLQKNYPKGFPEIGFNILKGIIKSNVVTKGLVEYVVGVFMVKSRVEGAFQNIYFLGEVHGSEGAGIWYFPVLYFTKLSLGLLLLIIFGSITAIWRFAAKKITFKEKIKNLVINPLSFSLFVFAFIYLAIALTSKFQIGLRHIMPVVIIIFLLTARIIDLYWNKKILVSLKTKHVFFACAFLMTLSTSLSFPDYLSFYNFFGGGAYGGYKIATDSNYDWGQDVKRLATWKEENDIGKIYTHIFTNVPLKYYLGEDQENYNLDSGVLPPSGSYIAVSALEYQNNVYREDLKDYQKYTRLKDNFVTRVGKTIFVFQVP